MGLAVKYTMDRRGLGVAYTMDLAWGLGLLGFRVDTVDLGLRSSGLRLRILRTSLNPELKARSGGLVSR